MARIGYSDDDILQKDCVGTRTAMCPICHWSMHVQCLFNTVLCCSPVYHTYNGPGSPVSTAATAAAGCSAVVPEAACKQGAEQALDFDLV